MTELVNLPSAPGFLTKTKHKFEPVFAFVFGALLSFAAWVFGIGWRVCSVIIFGGYSEDNWWKCELSWLVGSFCLCFTACLYRKTYFPKAVVAFLLGWLFGSFIIEFIHFRYRGAFVIDEKSSAWIGFKQSCDSHFSWFGWNSNIS